MMNNPKEYPDGFQAADELTARLLSRGSEAARTVYALIGSHQEPAVTVGLLISRARHAFSEDEVRAAVVELHTFDLLVWCNQPAYVEYLTRKGIWGDRVTALLGGGRGSAQWPYWGPFEGEVFRWSNR